MEVLSPKENAELFGHAHTEEQLLAMVESGRLPQSLLITGSKGIGKATMAYRFARFLLSRRQEEAPAMAGLFGDALPETPSFHMPAEHGVFRRVAQGAHPDLLIIEPTFDERKKVYRREILVDEVRKVNDFLSLTAAETSYRVVIIDSADAMNSNAANSLLKILEEPPPQSVLILLSHNPGKLLPTIRSRCLTIKMQPPAHGDFASIMQRYIPDLPAEDIHKLALLSYYSPGMALNLHQHNILTIYHDFLGTLKTAPLLDSYKLQQFLHDHGLGQWTEVEYILLWFISALGLYAMDSAAYTECVPGEMIIMHKMLTAKPLDYWLDLWEKASALCADTERLNLDSKQVLLTIFHGLEGTALP